MRLRTNYRLEDVYLYRLIPATPERARALFLDYLQSANKLHERAQWYNELTSNCTTNVRVHIKNIGSARPWDWQILVNGTIDEHAYQLGALDTSLPFQNSRAAATSTNGRVPPTAIRTSGDASGKDCRGCREKRILHELFGLSSTLAQHGESSKTEPRGPCHASPDCQS